MDAFATLNAIYALNTSIDSRSSIITVDLMLPEETSTNEALTPIPACPIRIIQYRMSGTAGTHQVSVIVSPGSTVEFLSAVVCDDTGSNSYLDGVGTMYEASFGIKSAWSIMNGMRIRSGYIGID